jgi:uncharacterized protein YndB with AHSA1/START domain
MAGYSFVTVWRIEAPIETLWEQVTNPETFPTWWTDVKSAELLDAGGENGVGAHWRYRYQSQLPYYVNFETICTKSEKPTLLEVTSQGDLSGGGRWTLQQEGTITSIIYEWNVETRE